MYHMKLFYIYNTLSEQQILRGVFASTQSGNTVFVVPSHVVSSLIIIEESSKEASRT